MTAIWLATENQNAVDNPKQASAVAVQPSSAIAKPPAFRKSMLRFTSCRRAASLRNRGALR